MIGRYIADKRFHGRRKGKKRHNLNNADALIQRYRLPIENFNFLYKEYSTFSKRVLEIGFGKGDFLYNFAKNNPDTLCLGAEVFLSGILSLMKKLETQCLPNLFIYDDNVYDILGSFPLGTFDSIYILFPDPWPKQRHHKRRIVNSYTLNIFNKLLKFGSAIYVVSDVPDFINWSIQQAEQCGTWDITVLRQPNFLMLNEQYFYTQYHQKALSKGIMIQYLQFKKHLCLSNTN